MFSSGVVGVAGVATGFEETAVVTAPLNCGLSEARLVEPSIIIFFYKICSIFSGAIFLLSWAIFICLIRS